MKLSILQEKCKKGMERTEIIIEENYKEGELVGGLK